MSDIQYDHLARERISTQYDAFRKTFLLKENLRAAGDFMVKASEGGSPTELSLVQVGGFNAGLKMGFKNSVPLLIRFPRPGISKFLEEKIRREVAIMQYLTDLTTIPVPFVLRFGMSNKEPGFGPFILMEFIPHTRDMSDVLNTPGFEKADRPILDPRISETTLKCAYSDMAHVLLQLSRASFSKIGSIEKLRDGSWSVTHRPLTMNMNLLVAYGNLPPSALPSYTFKSASEYFETLANLNITHLSIQRNGTIEDAEDCRWKYVGRYAFRNLISEQRFPTSPFSGPTPFKLFCDDFRPSKVLVDEYDKLVGVIDWEWTYAAPAEFAYSPPWWLLLEPPEEWPHGILDWAKEYEPRLRTFLEVLREAEDSMIKDGQLTERLSVRMQESWDTGDFWIAYAARKSWAFDQVFWQIINRNPRFFLKPGYEEALKLLSREERDDMEDFVKRKLKEKEECILVDWEETVDF
ncbi:hypothetical protein LSUB1_G006376 [Lachnellula subtilissima]|uniref:Aminoglycoside phosphotransferase domain-containing protein n=1 Tax=Lachnellula subtilissima TaxID=602034 RepID=A0A8H8RQ34_9HELO|nr:hypothetical protein LSUB1_G006376 [Lachnellula subtilissima]